MASKANGTVKPHTNGTVPVTNGSYGSYPSAYSEKYKLADHFIGGSRLEAAAPGKVKDFVASHDGHTVITSVRISLPLEICSICAVGANRKNQESRRDGTQQPERG